MVLHGGFAEPALALPSYAVLILSGVLALTRWGEVRSRPFAGTAAVILVGLIYLSVRAATSPDVRLGAYDFGIATAALLVWLLVAFVVTGPRERLVLIGAVLILSCGQAVISLLQYVKEEPDFGMYWPSAELRANYFARFGLRFRGLYLNPNHLAWLLNLVIFFASTLAIWGRMRGWLRVLLLYWAGSCVVLLVMTGSRGGIVSLLVGMLGVGCLGGWAAFVRHREGRKLVLIGGGAVAALLGVVFSLTFSASWMAKGRLGNEDISQNVRGLFNEHAWRLFQTEPGLGVGAGMFRYGARLYRTGQQPRDAVYVHNDWMQLLAEYGFVGFALLGVGFLLAVRSGGRGFLRTLDRRVSEGLPLASNSAAISIGAVGAILAFAAHSLVDFNLHLPANAMLAAFVLGILTNPGSTRGPCTASGRLFYRAVTAGLIAATTLVLTVFLVRHGEDDFRLLAARNAIYRGDNDRALAETKRVVERDPTNARAWALRGESFFSYEANLAFRDSADEGSLVIDGDSSLGPSGIGDYGLSEEYFRLAVDSYAKAVEFQPWERALRIRYANTLDEIGKHARAEEQLRAAIRLDPKHDLAYVSLGDHYYALDQYKKALRIYEIGAFFPWENNHARFQAEELIEELKVSEDGDL